MTENAETAETALTDMANQFLEATIPVVYNGMGLRFADVRPGIAAAEVPFDGNANHLGTMYAGVLFTVAEVLGGAMAFSFDLSRFLPVVKDMQIRYRRPATSKVRSVTSLTPERIAELQSIAEETGKAEFVLTAELTDESGEVVATTEGTYQLRAIGS